MFRTLLRGSFALATMLAIAAPALAVRVTSESLPRRAILADTIVVGKITKIEDGRETEKNKEIDDGRAFRIITLKVETDLIGADKLTELKIKFYDSVSSNYLRIGDKFPELKEGSELLFFLDKYPKDDFYGIHPTCPPVDVKSEQGKKDLEAVKKITAVLADPMKSLKSDKPQIRSEAAAIVILKYRWAHQWARWYNAETEEISIGAEESKLLLQALAEGNWSTMNWVSREPNIYLNSYQALFSLYLTERDGWKPPMIPERKPPNPPADFGDLYKDAYFKWLDGPGKDYQIKKVVLKKK